MAKKENLTPDKIAKFNCEDGKLQSFFWDAKIPGLGVRVTAAGAKSYIFESRIYGKSMRLTIGNIRSWDLAKARSEATRLKVMCDQGIDPRAQKAELKAKAETAQAESKLKATLVAEAWATYVNFFGEHWGERHKADHLSLTKAPGQPYKRGKGETVAGVLYELMEKSMGDISTAVITDWVKRESIKRASKTRHGYVLFKTFWGWCCERPEYGPFIDKDAFQSKELRAVVPSANTKKMDVLQRSQLQPWFAAVRNLSNPIVSAYLQALILTGARREEMAELRWEHVDFKWKCLWMKDKVDKEGRQIPLPPYLAQLLNSLPRRNEWVFSSLQAESGHLVEPRIAHNRALAASGVPFVTLHGLRRSFTTLAEWVETPKGIAAQIMGHQPKGTAEGHYIRRSLEMLAIWHSKFESWILKQAHIDFDAPDKTESLLEIQ